MEQTEKDILPDGVRTQLETEHGPIVAIAFRDKVFAFKRCTRMEFDLRETRLGNGDEEASGRLLQERCVWPSREEWNAFQDRWPLTEAAFWNAYSSAHGGGTYKQEGEDPVFTRRQGGEELTFTFRNVTRPESKRFQHVAKSDAKGEGMAVALEGLLRACCPEIGPWLDDNLYAISPLGKAFLKSQGLDLDGGDVVAK